MGRLSPQAVRVSSAGRGLHRLPIPDLIIAAAEAAGFVVLHYDSDFDAIAKIAGQTVEWVAPVRFPLNHGYEPRAPLHSG